MKVFRKHNASTLHDAFIKRVVTAHVSYLTWTQIEANATIFKTREDADSALNEAMSQTTNNYSYKYSILLHCDAIIQQGEIGKNLTTGKELSFDEMSGLIGRRNN